MTRTSKLANPKSWTQCVDKDDVPTKHAVECDRYTIAKFGGFKTGHKYILHFGNDMLGEPHDSAEQARNAAVEHEAQLEPA